jgi:hypothetical protein
MICVYVAVPVVIVQRVRGWVLVSSDGFVVEDV